MGWKMTGFAAWWLWRTFYLFRLPGASRKVRVALDWTLDLLFGRDICELQIARSERVARAHYEQGETIVRQGDPGDAFYIVEQGEVEVVRRRDDGDDVVLAVLGSGEFSGEQARMSQRRRNATVRARTAVDVIALGRDDFRALTGHWQMLRETLGQIAEDRAGTPDGPVPAEAKGAP
jgi:NADH dehydrogenase